jgi:hypothetical protein
VKVLHRRALLQLWPTAWFDIETGRFHFFHEICGVLMQLFLQLMRFGHHIKHFDAGLQQMAAGSWRKGKAWIFALGSL